MTTLKCLACDAPLPAEEAALPGVDVPRDDAIAVVHGGLFFRATGNYGSGIYDPFGEDVGYLEVVICDACIMRKSATHGIRHVVLDGRRVVGEAVYDGWRGTGAGVDWLAGRRHPGESLKNSTEHP